MNRRFIGFLQIFIAGLDLVMVNQALYLANLFFGERIPAGYLTHYLSFWLFVNTSWLLLCLVCGVYGERSISSFESFVSKTIRLYFFWIASIMGYLFFFHQF